MFAKREVEWDRERRAREKLMQDVYQQRQRQVKTFVFQFLFF